MAHDIFENRKQFQLERLILFSDAVFAIAITLLVIEIKIPHSDWSKPISEAQLKVYMLDVIPNILGFAFSFYIIGFYWTLHHRIFGHVINFDSRLIWFNLLLLFFIALLPFSTSLASEYGYLGLSFFYYWLNVGFIGLISFSIQLHIGNPKNNLSVGLEDKNVRHYVLWRSMLTCLIFFLGAFASLINNLWVQFAAKYVYVLIFPALTILRRIYKRNK